MNRSAILTSQNKLLARLLAVIWLLNTLSSNLMPFSTFQKMQRSLDIYHESVIKPRIQSYVFPPLSLTQYDLCNRSISFLSLRRRHTISIRRLTYILIAFGILLLRSYIQKWLASQQRNWKL